MWLKSEKKRILATRTWLLCNVRKGDPPACPHFPRELADKIAHYVYDAKDDEMTTRTYNRVDNSPMKLYDASMDMCRVYGPAEAPYYVIQRCVHKIREIAKFDQRGQIVSVGFTVTKLVTHTVRIVSEAEFERLRANGVPMLRGAAWNMETGEITQEERLEWMVPGEHGVYPTPHGGCGDNKSESA